MDRNRRFPNSTWAFSSDGIGIIVGSAMGTSPVTAYIDSATGIREGARTGLAALTCTFLFFIALFFNPLFGEFCISSPAIGLQISATWHVLAPGMCPSACDSLSVSCRQMLIDLPGSCKALTNIPGS